MKHMQQKHDKRKVIQSAATSSLKWVSFEYGGKPPNVVFTDADFSGAVKGAN